MSSINVQVPTCIIEVIDFITRPLHQTSWVSYVPAVKAMLAKSLTKAFLPTKSLEISISFAAVCTSKQIIDVAQAFNITWYNWHQGLGAKEMQFFIAPSSVTYSVEGDMIPSRLVWSMSTRFDRFLAEPPVPISKVGKLARLSDRESMHTYLGSILLAEEEDKFEDFKEATEIIAQASPFAILSPTPTREYFSALQVPRRPSGLWRTTFPCTLSSPESASPCSSPEGFSPASSRPSSRSSDLSSFTYSDEESLTSASSISSFEFISKPAFQAHRSTLLKAQVAVSAPAPIAVYVPPARKLRAPVSAPAAPTVVIEKKEITKYLYQGGVSTTLSGGVMLGGGSKPAAAPPTLARAPVARLPTVPHSAPPRFARAMQTPMTVPARLPASTQAAIASSILANPDPRVFTTPSKARPAPIGTGRRVPSQASPASASGSWRRGPASLRA